MHKYLRIPILVAVAALLLAGVPAQAQPYLAPVAKPATPATKPVEKSCEEALGKIITAVAQGW